MKTKKIIVIAAILAAAAITAILIIRLFDQKDGRETAVYEDMEKAFEQSGLLAANIGIYSKTEKDDNISYGEGGSGIIFDKKDNTYYALTAAHVVSDQNAQLLVFTANTEKKTDDISELSEATISQETYESMYLADVSHTSTLNDIAIIRFTAEEDLPLVEFAEANPNIDDRIMCIGNPHNEWFSISYGRVLSKIEQFGGSHGYPSNAMRHNAYIDVGSSGGAAFNEHMKLVGITPGGSYSLDGKAFHYGTLIPISEVRKSIEE